MIYKVFKILLIITLVLSPAVAFTQESPPNSGPIPLSTFLTIDTAPDYPGPNQEVSVSLRFSQADLDRANVSWFLNGEIQKSGVGEKAFTFKTGPIGTTSRVSVSVETLEGRTVNKGFIIRPSIIDLVWNAETYSPPFYRGKALSGHRSRVRVTATPQLVDSNGNLLNSKSLIYNWRENSTVLNDQSGLGKDVLILEGKLITRPRKITVTVESLDGNSKSLGSVVVNRHNPSVLIYQNNPLYGIMFNHALTEVPLLDQEISLVAIPYFFNVLSRNSEKIEYSWTQNDRGVGLPSQGSSITFGLPNGTELNKEIRIGVKAQNKEVPAQLGNRNVTLNLNQR
jgi:hypothetical protein